MLRHRPHEGRRAGITMQLAIGRGMAAVNSSLSGGFDFIHRSPARTTVSPRARKDNEIRADLAKRAIGDSACAIAHERQRVSHARRSHLAKDMHDRRHLRVAGWMWFWRSWSGISWPMPSVRYAK